MPTTVRPSPATGARLVDVGTPDSGVLDQWRDLAARAAAANPFQGPDLLLPAVAHLRDGGDVRLLVVPDPSRPDAAGLVTPVLPRRRYHRLPWRATLGWQHTHHFLGTPLVAPGFGTDGWRTALDALERDVDDAWLVLTDVDAAVAADVEAAATADGRPTRRLGESERPVTHRHATDDYLEQRLSGSRRKELRRVRRRLEEQLGGDLALVDLVAEGRLEEGVEAFLRLEAAGWKGEDGGAIAARPDERAFFTDACRRLAEHGRLEILSLAGRGGRPAAMGIDVRDGDTLFTLKIAYDEDLAPFSPGLLLYMEQLHRFHASDAAVLDTCAAPDHPMATRLHGDRRALVTLAVALRRGAGGRAVRAAPALLRAQDRARDAVRRRRTGRPAPPD